MQQAVWPVMNKTTPYVLLWGGALAVWAPIFWKILQHAVRAR